MSVAFRSMTCNSYTSCPSPAHIHLSPSWPSATSSTGLHAPESMSGQCQLLCLAAFYIEVFQSSDDGRGCHAKCQPAHQELLFTHSYTNVCLQLTWLSTLWLWLDRLVPCVDLYYMKANLSYLFLYVNMKTVIQLLSNPQQLNENHRDGWWESWICEEAQWEEVINWAYTTHQPGLI